MAGSLNHLVGPDGRLRLDLIDNIHDAGMALEECYNIIIELSGGDMKKVSKACRKLGYPDPWEKKRFDDDPMPAKMKRSP